jgi:hypothetical protein
MTGRRKTEDRAHLTHPWKKILTNLFGQFFLTACSSTKEDEDEGYHFRIGACSYVERVRTGNYRCHSGPHEDHRFADSYNRSDDIHISFFSCCNIYSSSFSCPNPYGNTAATLIPGCCWRLDPV